MRFRYSLSHCIRGNTWPYLGREGVSVDAVLRTTVVSQAVVDVYFLELVLVGQRAAGHVDMMSRRVVHSEHYAVPRVADTAAHLRQYTAQCRG